MTDKPTAILRELGDIVISDVFSELVFLATRAEDEKVKLAAIKEFFDRVYGKAGSGGGSGVPADGESEVVTGVPRNDG